MGLEDSHHSCGPSVLFQFHHDHMRRRLADVLTDVRLRGLPHDLTDLELACQFAAVWQNELPLEGGNRKKQEVRMRMLPGPFARLVTIFQNADFLVFETDLVTCHHRCGLGLLPGLTESVSFGVPFDP